MATHELPDFEVLVADLAMLERRERQVSADRRRLHDRLAKFPSDFAAERERQVSAERRELHARIDALRAELAVFAPPPVRLPSRPLRPAIPPLGLGEPPAA